MSYHDTLIEEINRRLDDLASRGDPLIAKWVAHSICTDHRPAIRECEHTEFWLHTSYHHTRDMVRRCINKRTDLDGPEVTSRQIDLPGFECEHLQDYYMVTREGEQIGVSIMNMTDDEIDEKIVMLKKLAKATYEHAEELERFKDWRKSARSA